MKPRMSSGRIQLFAFFIILCFSGALLLQIPAAYSSGKAVPFIDSLFTSVSAVCVTGLSTVDMSVYTRLGFIIIMILIELGGLGIISFISVFAALPFRKVSLVNRRIVREFSIDDIENNPKRIIKNILLYTVSIQLAGACILMPLFYFHGIKTFIFDAFFLAISAFCNSGLSVYSDSLERFGNDPAINAVIMALIVLGGIGFIVVQNILQNIKGEKKLLSLHTKLVLWGTALLILGGAAIFYCFEYKGVLAEFPLHKKISAAFFQSITTRTCGFDTIPQIWFSESSKLTTIFLMFIGGSPASIAGGIKTTTFFIAVLYALRGNEKNGTVNFWGRTIDAKTINKASIIIVKSVLLVFTALILLTIAESAKLQSGFFSTTQLLFETVSAFGTVGLSLNVTEKLSFWSKIIIIVTMFTGRTALAAMALLLPGMLEKHQLVGHPEESVLVG